MARATSSVIGSQGGDGGALVRQVNAASARWIRHRVVVARDCPVLGFVPTIRPNGIQLHEPKFALRPEVTRSPGDKGADIVAAVSNRRLAPVLPTRGVKDSQVQPKAVGPYLSGSKVTAPLEQDVGFIGH